MKKIFKNIFLKLGIITFVVTSIVISFFLINDYQSTNNNNITKLGLGDSVTESYTIKNYDDIIEEIYNKGGQCSFEGEGTITNPYLISTAEQLAFLSYLQSHDGYTPEIYNNLEDENVIINNENEETDYIKVEYLEAINGSSYIDTGVKANNSIGFYVDFQLTGYSNDSPIIGHISPNIYIGQNSLGFSFGFKNGTGRSGMSTISKDLERHQASLNYENNRKFYVDTETPIEFTETETVTQNANSIWFFKARNHGSGQVRIYNVKITSGEEVIRDFVPCVNKNTIESGFYDLINDVFYKNAGAGKFVLPFDISRYDFTDKYFELANDIYLNDGALGIKKVGTSGNHQDDYEIDYTDGGDNLLKQFNSIQNVKFNFTGNGKTIYGMYIISTSDKQGLFSSCYRDLKNIKIENCFVKGYILGNSRVGGIAGFGKASDCENGADIYADSYVGGIVGEVRAKYIAEFENCKNYGNILAGQRAGGICGVGGAINCVNYGNVSATKKVGTFGSAGGITCLTGDYDVYDCINYGSVTNNSTENDFGKLFMAGNMNNITISISETISCSMYNNVFSKVYAGEISLFYYDVRNGIYLLRSNDANAIFNQVVNKDYLNANGFYEASF